VPEAQWLAVDEERARYAHHHNVASNEGYVKFLGEVAEVVEGLATRGARVLDFGAGENAVLTGMLRGRGFECVAYDPLYELGTPALEASYDVVVMCEVIEHLRDLRAEIARLGGCLAPGGHIVVRTKCYPSVEQIPSWWYARDPTHLNFFSVRALEIAANLAGLSCRRTEIDDIFVWATTR